jgi:hypothetical protein
MTDTRRLGTPWEGWGWYEDYLVDPDGNRYSPEMIKTSIFTSQLHRQLVGSTGVIRSLRKELEQRLRELNSTPEVIIRFNGQETIVRLKAS